VLPHADPVHKVTILPTGMALGVTQQLPIAERHTYDLPYIEDTMAVRMGGRVAELLVFGTLTTGASNDLQGATELARKMVREFGMSEKIGPMAWGSQGMVFLGEDLMHTRDYSDETQHLIDEEVESILRAQEARATKVLREHRNGLDAVARTLLEKETIDGEEVSQLVDEAWGRPVHAAGAKSIPRFGSTEPTDAGPLGSGDSGDSGASEDSEAQGEGEAANGRRRRPVRAHDPTEVIER
jgi:cell division protease FtsH